MRTALVDQKAAAMTVSRFSMGRLREAGTHAFRHRPRLLIAVRVVINLGAFIILFQIYKLVRQTFARRSESIGFDNAVLLIS